MCNFCECVMTIADTVVKVNNDAGHVFGSVVFTSKPVDNCNACLEYAHSVDADLTIVQVNVEDANRAVFYIFNKPGTTVSAKQIAEMFGGTGGGHDDNCGIINVSVDELTVETLLRTTLQI